MHGKKVKSKKEDNAFLLTKTLPNGAKVVQINDFDDKRRNEIFEIDDIEFISFNGKVTENELKSLFDRRTSLLDNPDLKTAVEINGVIVELSFKELLNEQIQAASRFENYTTHIKTFWKKVFRIAKVNSPNVERDWVNWQELDRSIKRELVIHNKEELIADLETHLKQKYDIYSLFDEKELKELRGKLISSKWDKYKKRIAKVADNPFKRIFINKKNLDVAVNEFNKRYYPNTLTTVATLYKEIHNDLLEKANIGLSDRGNGKLIPIISKKEITADNQFRLFKIKRFEPFMSKYSNSLDNQIHKRIKYAYQLIQAETGAKWVDLLDESISIQKGIYPIVTVVSDTEDGGKKRVTWYLERNKDNFTFMPRDTATETASTSNNVTTLSGALRIWILDKDYNGIPSDFKYGESGVPHFIQLRSAIQNFKHNVISFSQLVDELIDVIRKQLCICEKYRKEINDIRPYSLRLESASFDTDENGKLVALSEDKLIKYQGYIDKLLSILPSDVKKPKAVKLPKDKLFKQQVIIDNVLTVANDRIKLNFAKNRREQKILADILTVKNAVRNDIHKLFGQGKIDGNVDELDFFTLENQQRVEEAKEFLYGKNPKKDKLNNKYWAANPLKEEIIKEFTQTILPYQYKESLFYALYTVYGFFYYGITGDYNRRLDGELNDAYKKYLNEDIYKSWENSLTIKLRTAIEDYKISHNGTLPNDKELEQIKLRINLENPLTDLSGNLIDMGEIIADSEIPVGMNFNFAQLLGLMFMQKQVLQLLSDEHCHCIESIMTMVNGGEYNWASFFGYDTADLCKKFALEHWHTYFGLSDKEIKQLAITKAVFPLKENLKINTTDFDVTPYNEDIQRINDKVNSLVNYVGLKPSNPAYDVLNNHYDMLEVAANITENYTVALNRLGQYLDYKRDNEVSVPIDKIFILESQSKPTVEVLKANNSISRAMVKNIIIARKNGKYTEVLQGGEIIVALTNMGATTARVIYI